METGTAWNGFNGTDWKNEVNVRDFIQQNYVPYEGDSSFLAGATEKTLRVWKTLEEDYLAVERKSQRRVYDIDVTRPAGITAYPAGYISPDDDVVPGLQTDVPLKRAMMPFGGWKMVEAALRESGREPDEHIKEAFTRYRKTHNDGVFDVYTPRVRAARSSHVLTGLPDSYGRGRILPDLRRVALYGVDFLIASKKRDKDSVLGQPFSEDWVRFREEHSEQIRALAELKELGAFYGLELGRPAHNAQEAVQWTYMAYLAAIKSQDGAAMSVGRLSAFLDVYFQRDLAAGLIDEQGVQELIDHFIIKLRIVRFLRTEAYDRVFAGDPIWSTLTLAGNGNDGRTLTTKTDFRILQTLRNLGAAPEPNITVFWSHSLPEGFKRFCAEISLETSAIQYENDDIISSHWSDDAAIACCVSPVGSPAQDGQPMKGVGSGMQFFGARMNILKVLLYAINGGRDDMTGKQVIEPGVVAGITGDGALDYDEVWAQYDTALTWISEVYVEALNIIHMMHDKYAYEAIEMALHDKDVFRTLACGIAGLSHVADSLSAIKYAKVFPVRNEDGLVVDYRVEGNYPKYGNDDDRVDEIATLVVKTVMDKIRSLPTYRNSVPTQSVLTITSNVVYGSATGNTPDGRRAGEPFAPGANPSNGMDTHGALAAMMSLAKIDYEDAQDGISLTITLAGSSCLGRTHEEQATNLVGVLDAGFVSGLYHANINVLDKATLLDAVEHPEKYPNLVCRVSGYAVNFTTLTKQQQLDVISRTFHSRT